VAVPGDKLESKAEFRIRTVHSVHAYMPSLHYELSPGPFEQRPPSSRDRPKPACGDAIMRLSLLCKSGAAFPHFVAAQALAKADVRRPL
jgi:hypothetical protein